MGVIRVAGPGPGTSQMQRGLRGERWWSMVHGCGLRVFVRRGFQPGVGRLHGGTPPIRRRRNLARKPQERPGLALRRDTGLKSNANEREGAHDGVGQRNCGGHILGVSRHLHGTRVCASGNTARVLTPFDEPPKGRQVLDCASPLALWLEPAGRIESARGLAQSKTLTRGRRFMAPMRVWTLEVEAPHESANGFKAFTDWLVLISERFESSGVSCGRVHGKETPPKTGRELGP